MADLKAVALVVRWAPLPAERHMGLGQAVSPVVLGTCDTSAKDGQLVTEHEDLGAHRAVARSRGSAGTRLSRASASWPRARSKSVAAGVGPDPQSADADQDLFL